MYCVLHLTHQLPASWLSDAINRGDQLRCGFLEFGEIGLLADEDGDITTRFDRSTRGVDAFPKPLLPEIADEDKDDDVFAFGALLLLLLLLLTSFLLLVLLVLRLLSEFFGFPVIFRISPPSSSS